MDPSRLVEFLEASPDGAKLWIQGMGTSMKPLLQSGDLVRVEKCTESSLHPGDIALVRFAGGSLAAHVVLDLGPLRTAGLGRSSDRLGASVLGRVIALRRRGIHVALPRFSRSPVLWIHRLLSAMRREDAGERTRR